MTVGSTYGCLTVLDLGEEYIKSEQSLHAQKEHEELQNSLCQYDDITEEYSRNLSSIESIGFVKKSQDYNPN